MKDSEYLISEAKSALFDLIADIRVKLQSDDLIKKDYDALLKQMVLNSGSINKRRSLALGEASDDEAAEQSPFQPVVDLTAIMKNLIEIIGRNIAYQAQQYDKQGQQVQELQYDIANGERELRKRLDVVYRVFK